MTEPEDLTLTTDRLAPGERDLEAPDADALEQATAVEPDDDRGSMSDSLEAPTWDAHEQSLTVQFEDDYR